MTIKQQIGRWLIPGLPVNRHAFDHLRLELNALSIGGSNRFNPAKRRALKRLRASSGALLNIGCGPFGKPEGWINLDLFPAPYITARVDCRRRLPLSNNSCRGIHVEHFYEHLSPIDERRDFVVECLRCLEPGGVMRIVVPDAELYIKAYLADGWGLFNEIGCGGDRPEGLFATKMQALNHIFLQGAEHYGGLDWETIRLELEEGGFSKIQRHRWREGTFPEGPIDREQHEPYSLYVEATK